MKYFEKVFLLACGALLGAILDVVPPQEYVDVLYLLLLLSWLVIVVLSGYFLNFKRKKMKKIKKLKKKLNEP